MRFSCVWPHAADHLDFARTSPGRRFLHRFRLRSKRKPEGRHTRPVESVIGVMREQGGVVARAALDAAGCTSADVDGAIRCGEVIRVRKGWFATPDAPRDVVRAVRVGGVATAGTVARLRGLWVADDPRLHVRVRYSTGRLFAPHDRRQPLDRMRDRVCVHYSRRGPFDRAVDALTVSLAEMFACTDVASAIASVDSALDTGNLSLQHLDLIRAWMPPSRKSTRPTPSMAT